MTPGCTRGGLDLILGKIHQNSCQTLEQGAQHNGGIALCGSVWKICRRGTQEQGLLVHLAVLCLQLDLILKVLQVNLNDSVILISRVLEISLVTSWLGGFVASCCYQNLYLSGIIESCSQLSEEYRAKALRKKPQHRMVFDDPSFFPFYKDRLRPDSKRIKAFQCMPESEDKQTL